MSLRLLQRNPLVAFLRSSPGQSRNYYVPRDRDPTAHSFTPEDNLFGELQEFLSMQERIKRVVIHINNPNLVSRFCREHPVLYSIDLHYKNSGLVKTLEGNHCETLVRQTLTFLRFHDEKY